MKKTNKKGFTIVELVIVIAVIAILSAVLIPTFTSIVAKANLAADKQTVRQLNVALAAGEKADTYNEMADVLEAQGFNAKYDKVAAPASIGHSYFWSVEHNTIVLVKDNAVVFPENDNRFTSFDADNQAKWLQISTGYYVVTSTATTAEAAKADIAAAVAGGNSITLSNNVGEITLDSVNVKKDASIKIDLAGSKLSTNNRASVTDKVPQQDYAMDVFGNVEIVNAEIDARGIEVHNGGVVTLGEGVVINATGTNGGAAVWVYEGGEAIINGGTYSVSNESTEDNTDGTHAYSATVIASYGKLTINGGTFTNRKAGRYAIEVMKGEAHIENATIYGFSAVCVSGNATATLKNCDITAETDQGSRHCVYVGSGTLTIDGGSCEMITSAANSHALYVSAGATATVKAGTVISGTTHGTFVDER